LAEGEKDCGLPFMAYEGKAQALVAMGKTNDPKKILEDALAKARSQQKPGHEADLLILLGTFAAQVGDRQKRSPISKMLGSSQPRFSSIEWKPTPCSSWRSCIETWGIWRLLRPRATQGLIASQRVGDRYYLPRNLTVLADLKARRGHVAEANALYDQAEDVIEGMLISVEEPYWNSSVVAAQSRTYLQHFDLLARRGDVPEAFRVLERVRGRTLAWALEDRKAFPTLESEQTASLETDVAGLQARLMQSGSAPKSRTTRPTRKQNSWSRSPGRSPA
jgi:hypothetical protein